jgi:DNA-binding NtrC family response regulator
MPNEAGRSLRDVERQLFEQTLRAVGGNRTRTAEMLGISVRTVRNKINEYGLRERLA